MYSPYNNILCRRWLKIPTIFTEEFEPISGQKHQLLEATTRNGGPQVKIKAIMQTANDVNKNKRIYPKDVLEEGIEKLKPLMKQHALTGEL